MHTKANMEKVLQQTYAGIALLYRDANLGPIGDKYAKGQIIKELGFTDASRKGGGIVTSHRYAILSTHFMDASKFEQGTNWGLCMMQHGSYFKVLDVYQPSKTQITLLHLMPDSWQLFQHTSVSVDEELVQMVRKRFDECLTLPPVKELNTPEWLQRCRAPLGMSDEGILFPVE